MSSIIVLYKGRRGAGKTLSMVKDAYKFYCYGWEVYSNIDLNFPHIKIDSDFVLNIGKTDIENCLFLIDEIQVLIDSRRSGSKDNVNFSHFIQQIRKRKISILCTTQYAGTMDLRLRQHLDIIATPSYNEDLKVCEVHYTDITSLESNDGLYNMFENSPIKEATVIFDARKVFDLYDTYNIIKQKQSEKKKKGEQYAV